jgi:hypothetical protein
MPVPARSEAGAAARILLVVAAAALLLTGCGSKNDQPAQSAAGNTPAAPAEPLGEDTAGSVAQLAQCRDWNRGDRAEKLATVEDIRSQVNRSDSGFRAPPLTDDEAIDLFDTACAASYAQGFRLYILYARGAAAAPLVRE